MWEQLSWTSQVLTEILQFLHELGNSYPLSICQGIRQFSEEIFFLSLPENLSFESSSRIFCSQREARVKFINKIDSEVAWMTWVLNENFSSCCLTANLFYVLVNVLNKGAHYLSEVTRPVTCFFFQNESYSAFFTWFAPNTALQNSAQGHAEGKIVLVKRCLCITYAVKIYYFSHSEER